MSEVLELETRKKIYAFIEQNPGVNLSTIADKLDISSQLVDYHLIYLDRHGIATIVKEGGFKRCYIKGQVGSEDKKILSLLRQETPLLIILFLLKNPYSRYRDVMQNLKISSPLFSYHLRKLVKQGVIIASTEGPKTGYKVCNETEVVNFIIRYKPTTILENVQDVWMDFYPG